MKIFNDYMILVFYVSRPIAYSGQGHTKDSLCFVLEYAVVAFLLEIPVYTTVSSDVVVGFVVDRIAIHTDIGVKYIFTADKQIKWAPFSF
jgi:hypothetical protein